MFRHKTKVSLFVIALLVAIIGGGVIVSSQNSQNRSEVSSSSGLKQKPNNLKVPQNQQNQQNRYIPQFIPDDVTYRMIFRHIEELNKQADKEEKQKGKDGRDFRNSYKKSARLDERQARVLDRIASETNRELSKLDNRAKQIVEQVRSQTPNRRIERGQKPPLPPQELFNLSKQRKDLTLKAINEFRTNVGEAEFIRFNQFLSEKIKPTIRKRGNGNLIQKGGQPR